jgi:sulfite exporter TauE/SafE
LEAVNLYTVVIIAFLGSFGHCIGMCGGIVLAYTSTKVDSSFNKTQQTLSHLSYSLGRVTTYTALGVFFGGLGQVISMSHIGNGVLLIVAGVIMLLSGLSLLGKLRFLNLIEYSTSKSGWYQRNFKRLIHSKSLYSFFALGMLNGLLPCGFVYFFAVTAASTGSALWGGVVMFIFGLSTIPALFSLGFFTGLFKLSSFRDIMIKIASIVIIIYSVVTLYYGYKYLSDPKQTLVDCPACEVERSTESK